MMYVINNTEGSVLLPNGQDLVTWLAVTDEDAVALAKYDGGILKLSKTKPKEEKTSVPLPIEESVVDQGFTSLSDALKKEDETPPEAPSPSETAAPAPAAKKTGKKAQ